MKLNLEKKNSGLNGIRTHDLCDAGAVLYQLSYQANWELATLWVRNIPVDGEEYKRIYIVRKIMYLNREERCEDVIDQVSYRKHDIKTFQHHTGCSLQRLSPRAQETPPVQRHID